MLIVKCSLFTYFFSYNCILENILMRFLQQNTKLNPIFSIYNFTKSSIAIDKKLPVEKLE